MRINYFQYYNQLSQNKPIEYKLDSMGNQNSNSSQFIEYLSTLQVVKQGNFHYLLRQKAQKKEYLKIIHPIETYKQTKNNKQAEKLMLIGQYIKFRYNYQNQTSVHYLPKILVYGQQIASQNVSINNKSLQTVKFSIFEHPTHTLAEYLQEKILSGKGISDKQSLNIICQWLKGINQMCQIRKYLQKQKKFDLLSLLQVKFNQNSLYVNKENKIFLSDIIILAHSKNNFSESISPRTRFIQNNLNSLSDLFENLLSKNNLTVKSIDCSLKSSRSMLTGVNYHSHTNVNNTKSQSSICYSFELQNLLKLMRRPNQNVSQLIVKVQELIQKQAAKQNVNFSRSNSKKSLITIISSRNTSSHKKQKQANKVKQQDIHTLQNKLKTIVTNQNNQLRTNNKSQTKIRLSLKKGQKANGNKQNENLIRQSIQSNIDKKLNNFNDKKLNGCNNKKPVKIHPYGQKKILDNFKQPEVQQLRKISNNKPSMSDSIEDKAHLNPISNKKTIRNKLTKIKGRYLQTNFQNIDLQCLQNISSIFSNQNTVSSIGNPLIEEFKTQNSQIYDQGIQEDNQVLLRANIGHDKKFLKDISSKINNLPFPAVQEAQSIISSYQKSRQKQVPEFLKQFKLPEKNLLALNNIILKQKDMILEESFEQSQLNSCRQSVSIQPEQLKKRKSKLLDDFLQIKIQEQPQLQYLTTEREQNEGVLNGVLEGYSEILEQDSIVKGFKLIQNSIIESSKKSQMYQ